MSDTAPETASEVGPEVDADLAAVRAERRRLKILGRVMQAVGLLFIGWGVYALIIAERRDTFYVLPSLFGTVTGLSRYFVHKVVAAPRALYALRDGSPAERERAWQLIAGHREEILGQAIVSQTIREEPLLALSREAMVTRLARLGTTDWRRVLRVWVTLWVPAAVVVFVLTLTFVSTAGR